MASADAIQFQVPPSALCLAFEQELGRFDVVRCHYRMDNWSVRLTATAQLTTISLFDSEVLEGTPLEKARLVADELFDPGLGLTLREVGRVAYFTIGELDVEAPAAASTGDGGWAAPWHAAHTWWYRPGVVGFITVKPSSDEAAGQPPPEVTDQANQRWFSKDRPNWFRPRKR
ncbi:MAG: hypothetical protein JRI68_05590 [Deltaproteobacteria bacterium]|nr:hypothetical protein [Deltaproteobacteria bacterium]